MCLTFCDSRRIAGAGCARPVCGRSQETVTRDQPSPFVATRERIGARGLDNAVCTDNRAYIQASCAGRQSRCAHNHRTRHRRGETSDRRNGAQALPRSSLVRGAGGDHFSTYRAAARCAWWRLRPARIVPHYGRISTQRDHLLIPNYCIPPGWIRRRARIFHREGCRKLRGFSPGGGMRPSTNTRTKILTKTVNNSKLST